MKKYTVAALSFCILGAVSIPALAQDQPTTKGPPVRMGDDGKLPATDTITNKVPEMGATSSTGTSDGTAGSASPKGPPQRMGDEGKLPATGTVSGAVPQMTPPAK
jgi:hypothetical protein